jgi:hypothetical protein
MRRIATILLAASAACSGTAAAEPIIRNGVADLDGGTGREFTRWLQADDFVMPHTTAITGASFEWFTLGGLSSWDRSLNWSIFADDAGSPGALLASGGGVSVLTEHRGSFEFDRFETTFDFDVPISLAGGGRYWFGLHLASDFAVRDDLYWADSTSAFGESTRQSFGGSLDNWADVSGVDRAFMIIPTPGTSAAVALLGVVAIRRRSR